MISFDDVYGAAVDEKRLHVFQIFALVPVSAKKREEKQFAFKCASMQIAAKAVDVIKHILAGVPLQGSSLTRASCSSIEQRERNNKGNSIIIALTIVKLILKILDLFRPYQLHSLCARCWC